MLRRVEERRHGCGEAGDGWAVAQPLTSKTVRMAVETGSQWRLRFWFLRRMTVVMGASLREL